LGSIYSTGLQEMEGDESLWDLTFRGGQEQPVDRIKMLW
jgi:hypothetical protein